ncbi:hypothetical protein MMC21_004241 [Puttea exsequens]|nr:hypothetical protein [Puttea exsequens]
MSFGYSVGDCVAVATLAYKIFEKCQAAPDEFKDLAYDSEALRFILKAIQDYWQKNDNVLPYEHRNRVAIQLRSCREVLLEVDEKLATHPTLGGSASLIDRVTWAFGNVKPLRDRIRSNRAALAELNTLLWQTSSAHFTESLASQARLIEFLTKRILDKSNAPQDVARALRDNRNNIYDDNDEIWTLIGTAVADSRNDVLSGDQKRFVRTWLDRVKPQDDLDDGFGPQATSPLSPTLSIASLAISNEQSHSNSVSRNEEARSTMRDILNLKYSKSRNSAELDTRVQSVFEQTCVHGVKHLSRMHVERLCQKALEAVELPVSQRELRAIINDRDQDHNKTIDLQEFNAICC